MSIEDILLNNWLNNQLKFEPKITDIRTDFKNGFYFGQLLLKLKIISEEEFNRYLNSEDSDDVKKNYSLLLNDLSEKLNYKLRNEEIDEVINNKNRNSIVLLLYKIKNSYYKYKINFNNIQDSLTPMTQKELNQKVQLILEFNNNDNETFEDNKINENFLYPKEKITKPKRIKIQKVTFSSKNNNDNNKKELSNEKLFMNKRMVLPKIQRDQNHNQNYDSSIINAREYFNKSKNKSLSKNNSEVNLLEYPPLSLEKIWKKPINYNQNNRNKSGLGKEISKSNSSLTNIFQNRIKLINAKTINMDKSSDASEPEYNFIKKDKHLLDNILNKLAHKQNAYNYLEKNFVLFNVPENSKYKSALKRKEYSDIWKKENEKKIVIKRLNNFNRLIYNMEMSQKPKKDIAASTDLVNKVKKNDNTQFNYNLFFKEVDNLDMEKFNEYCDKKYKIFRKHYNMIKSLVLLIINVTMEGYIYQAETKKDLIDIPFYLKLIKLFLKNKKIKRKIIIDEFKIIKEVGPIDEIFDFKKIKLQKDELFFLKDYSYYIGFWNKNRIIDNNILGKKLDYKLLFYDKKNLEEYEPTEMENEDLTFPAKLINNFDFGDFISEFIEHKYSQLKKINNTVNNTNQISKWFYIQYKIVLIGQSFIGNKYTSQLFNKKYPNLKVYSIFKLLNEYCSEYKKLISEPEEESSRAKSKRKNQAELNKKQKEERLEELKPIIEIIKPYLELEENNNQTENNNSKSNNQNNIIPQDDVLLKLLIYQIEKDFPEKTQKELADEIKEISNKMNNILDKIEDIKNNFDENEKPKEKEKKGSKKDKEENVIDNLEKELSNLKEESIKGFIIIDFPNNLNQCYLLENYLTGYINEMERPKSLKDIEVKKISEIIDIKYQPKNEKIIKNSGIDFLINLSSKENDVNTLFTNIKYDPKEDYIYSKMELDNLNDKKAAERLVDNIPYFDLSLSEYYKKEYEENISKIHLFYDKFGYILDEKSKYSNNPFVSFGKKSIDVNNKIIKVYQAMILTDLNQQVTLNTNVSEVKKKKKIIKNVSIKSNKSARSNKSNKDKREKDNDNDDKEKTNNSNLSPSEIYQMATKNVTEFFTNRIEALYDSNNKRNTILVRNVAENENSRLVEIKRVKTKKTILLPEKDKIIYNLKYKSEELLNSIYSFNEKYTKDLTKFIYLLLSQRNNIFQRFNLIQKKFRDYLNRETSKKEIIHKYVNKYNNFFDLNKDLLKNESVKKEFMSDIEFININLWQIINLKKRESIAELNEIKNCGYIEVEMCKFFNNIKDLFYSETNKYIGTINILIDFYMRYFINDKVATMKSSNVVGVGNTQNRLINIRDELNNNLTKVNESQENFLFNDCIPVEEILKLGKEKNDINLNNNFYNYDLNNKNNKTKYSSSLNQKIKLITKNINTMFFNCIKLMMSENEQIVPFLKLLSEINNSLKKKLTLRAKKTSVFGSDVSSQNNLNNNNSGKEKTIISEETFQSIIKNEKDKLKYRLIFIKDFAIKYIFIISQIYLKIFENADDWVIKSIHKENETQNEVINLLKYKLQQIEKIDEELEIDTIEMDAFEKRIDDEEKNSSKISDIKIRPIDNTSVITSGIYNKINLDFLINDNFFDIKLVKKEQIEQNEKNNNKNKNIHDYINEIRDYEISLSKLINNNVGNYYVMSEKSSISNEEELLKEEDFYYDVEKFLDVYKEITYLEEEKNIINYDILFEVFIKQYLINNKEEKNKYEYNAICNNLQKLNIKQILHLIDLCKINFENKKDNIEYEVFIKTSEFFTLLSLIGAEILTSEKEEQILKDFDDKFINGKYVEKKEFIKYQFWFEKFFEFQTINLNNDDNEFKYNEKDQQMNIKEFLFEVWNDGNGNIDLKKLLEVLRLSNYITDFVEYNGKKYFDVIFLEQ